jgi:hypothetical protein
MMRLYDSERVVTAQMRDHNHLHICSHILVLLAGKAAR